MKKYMPFNLKKTAEAGLVYMDKKLPGERKNTNPNRTHFGMPQSFPFKACYAILLLLFCFFNAIAQQKPVAPVKKTAPATTPPAAMGPKAVVAVLKAPSIANMDEYRQTPQYSKRVAQLSSAFPDPPVKVIKFADNTKDNIKVSTAAPSNMDAGAIPTQHGQPTKTTSGGYDCTTTVISVNANSSDFTINDYSNTIANITPGACFLYSNISSGNWQEQTGARNTIQISADIHGVTGNTYVYVQNPNLGTIGTATNQLIAGFGNNSYNMGASFQTTIANSSAAYNVTIGAGVSGYGADLTNVYSTGSQSNHVHLTISGIKPLFTLTTTPPDSGFFKSASTEATPYLTFIGSVTYGVRILANADLTFSSEAEADEFKGSYSGVISANLDVSQAANSKSTNVTINGYFVGGSSSGVFIANSMQQLLTEVNNVFTNANYQNAAPISYTVCSMAGKSLYTQNATDNFNVQNCIPSDGGSTQIGNVSVQLRMGNDGKEPATGYSIRLYTGLSPNITDPKVIPMFTYYCPVFSKTPYNNNSTVTIQLQKNAAYQGNVDVTTFQKAGGGTLVIGPIDYTPNATAGIGYDNWKIDQTSLIINPKITAANPNPKPIGPSGGQGINWVTAGSNEVVLSSSGKNVSRMFFDPNFNPQGNQ